MMNFREYVLCFSTTPVGKALNLARRMLLLNTWIK